MQSWRALGHAVASRMMWSTARPRVGPLGGERMSTDETDPKRVSKERSEVLDALAKSPQRYGDARAFAKRMRAARAFDELGVVCDAMRYYDPNDLIIRVWEAQSLVDRGMPMAARDVLLPALKLAVEKNDEVAWFEIQGLLGRAAK